jgi:hypothetical protein
MSGFHSRSVLRKGARMWQRTQVIDRDDLLVAVGYAMALRGFATRELRRRALGRLL